MRPLKKVAALAVVLIGILSFSIKEHTTVKPTLSLDGINIDELLTKQQFECRPTSDFMFYVETDLVKKIRGANNINAKVYLLDKATGRKNLISQENIQIKKYQDAIALDGFNTDQNFKNTVLQNGDKIIGGSGESLYAFDELIKNETIYNGYINATNKLLRLKRSI